MEALEIRKRLTLDNPQRYEPDVATTQNNLGIMYRNLNAYDRAEAVYLEALEIRKRLTLDNPQRYEPDVAMTQNNLGNMYSGT
ncbi:MAG: tetratricopeptide repeat protein [Lewinellaceae bacterium]|nr:tetratricopeptide repeat protein [Lewinellaceae bacterium]